MSSEEILESSADRSSSQSTYPWFTLSLVPMSCPDSRRHPDPRKGAEAGNKTGFETVPPAPWRCSHFGLQTLEDWRTWEEVTKTYKLLHGFEDVPFTKFFHFNTNNLREHSLKLSKPDHWTTNTKGHWFTPSDQFQEHTPWELCNSSHDSYIKSMVPLTHKWTLAPADSSQRWGSVQKVVVLFPYYHFLGMRS